MTADPVDYHQFLVEHLDLVDRVVRYVARRHHLSVTDAEEFSSVVRVRLIEHDYAVLRRFQGRSQIGTYLTAVVERMYLDFCVARFGKWRSSATARRMGPVAMALERLVARDGLSFDEAAGTLHTNHGVSETLRELHEMFVQLPVRSVRHQGSPEELARLRQGVIDSGFDRRADAQLAQRIEAALLRATGRLSAHDRLIIKLRYFDDLPVSSIAGILQIDSKRLYRRLDYIYRQVREALQQDGIDGIDIDRVVGHPSLALDGVLQQEIPAPAKHSVPDNHATRPSNA